MSSESLPQQSADSSAAEKLFAEQMAAEREYVARVYARLDELREETAEKLAAVRKNQAVGGHQNRSERDSFATHYEDRLAQLNAVDSRLTFTDWIWTVRALMRCVISVVLVLRIAISSVC